MLCDKPQFGQYNKLYNNIVDILDINLTNLLAAAILTPLFLYVNLCLFIIINIKYLILRNPPNNLSVVYVIFNQLKE